VQRGQVDVEQSRRVAARQARECVRALQQAEEQRLREWESELVGADALPAVLGTPRRLMDRWISEGRLENLPGPIALKRMMAAMIDLFCDSFAQVPERIVLDIDDTENAVHDGQQLALFNAHYDSHCFLPIHIYEAANAKPVAIFLRPGKTPDGAEFARVLRHVIRHIRARWPRVRILIRGDSHYGRIAAITLCERHRDVGSIFGLGGNRVLLRKVADLAEDVALRRLDAATQKVCRHADVDYAAKAWPRPPDASTRRVIARIEAGPQGTDTRFIITNLEGTPEHLYEDVYCARGQAENLIKAHKLHLASDRTSCTKATASQFRLLVHTAAYWLMLTLRGLAPKLSFLTQAPSRACRGPSSVLREGRGGVFTILVPVPKGTWRRSGRPAQSVVPLPGICSGPGSA
jgi:hypothetical protein